ncbi:FecR family protein [Phytopseudomonas dryadis]|uniref:Iron dicitrate transport regulator FecR n=1 Tax=Phytopseudomonas dryadis TaxID=2487520 RepID=A0A4Q9R2F6_9GAMM|nr:MULTISPECIES: FecR family protein [Pseudomonas]TBU93414.1 iron dicitrate transport regulator FecR [Pseudomonas dryadis]TBV07078.1 iron dicitrate transport regulator FecR [Pseudomonas dryadis]TBV19529.1 iron dicitrate transport regulator FecR [Pseudomonas sp. FRB 230]
MNDNKAMQSVDEQAAYWFSRCSGNPLSAEQDALLQAWLAADPAHARAFSELQRIWAECDRIRRPATPPAEPVRPRRWSLFRELAACAMIVGGLLLSTSGGLWERPGYELELQTARGEQRDVELQDGSRISLNVDSRIRVRFYTDRREVRLTQGEAYFAVAPAPGRPFDVLAGEGRVRVVGTRFTVRRGAQSLGVAVESGRVALQADADDLGETLLGAGDSADYDYRTATLQRTRRGADEIASWRQGQLIFHNRPLGQLLDELSAYREAPVQLGDARLAGLQVSGSLNIEQPDDFLAALPHLLPVQVERLRDGRALIHPR